MADLKRNEIENALNRQVQQIDRLYLRKIQKFMFECSAKCCENSSSTAQEVQRCVDNCNQKLVDSHKFVTSEIQNYQSRLQRCVSQCNDDARDHLGADPNEAQIAKATKMFEDCACKCIDTHIEILPQFMSKVHEVMRKKVEAVTGAKIQQDQILEH